MKYIEKPHRREAIVKHLHNDHRADPKMVNRATGQALRVWHNEDHELGNANHTHEADK